jgi:outer membrane protein OmpA-like peptidoglycan-associated protein
MFTKQIIDMKLSKTYFIAVVAGLLAISLNSCKTKKIAAKPPAPVVKETPKAEEKQPETAPVTEKKEEPATVVDKPNYNFSNVQFEFNSGVLKTDSYQILDQVAKEMKKDPSVKFILNGHSSAEGTVEHNMSLSVDRANSVKSYLVNAGVSAENLTIKGFGAGQPMTSNDTEEGRALNRRVEFKVTK